MLIQWTNTYLHLGMTIKAVEEAELINLSSDMLDC